MRTNKGLLMGCCLLAAVTAKAQPVQNKPYHEPYRLQAHFSPKAKWMNDPNGIVYYKGTYHIFFQHYPGDVIWGPMHWGHAISPDLIHWKQLPVALYPDSLGYIFSGSIVADVSNTSGFGKNGQPPLVAIFTHHDPKGEKAGVSNYQNESLAYSNDNGNTWTKYKANPVLKSPGIKDFRDPKVFWYAPQKKWLMSLATKDRITFYSSKNLKHWIKESEFGQGLGAHGGVWECPDLISLKLNGKTYWVLLVSINPGGVNGGSLTQYFVGQFNGNRFNPINSKTKWIDYGPDDYAGVTWANTGERKIFLGWMGNWTYANQVATKTWRNAMTIPRDLSLRQLNGDIYLASAPVKELQKIALKPVKIDAKAFGDGNDLAKSAKLPGQYLLKFSIPHVQDYAIILSNDAGEKLIIGYAKAENRYYLNRENSGKVDFNKEFAKLSFAPRISRSVSSDVELLVDASSVELFADGGISNLTGVFFPKSPYNHIAIQSKGMIVDNLTVTPLKSIW